MTPAALELPEHRPAWLTPSCAHDVEKLVDAHVASEGRTRRSLAATLSRLHLASLDASGREVVGRVVGAFFDDAPLPSVDPKAARMAVFLARRGSTHRDSVLAVAAAALRCTPQDIEAALFADLPRERLVRQVGDIPPTPHLIEESNLGLLRRYVLGARSLRLALKGNARAVVRALGRSRLIAEHRTEGDLFLVDVSGPLSLHRSTVIYGRALARFVPALAWCEAWRLEAVCGFPDGERRVVATHRDPLLTDRRRPARFDSMVEERLWRDFLRLGGSWVLAREPVPIRAGERTIFPDFSARHADDGRRAFVEVVGFWTTDYLEKKLEAFRKAARTNVVLVVDEALSVGPGDLPRDAALVRYRRRVDPKAVAEALERVAHRDEDGAAP